MSIQSKALINKMIRYVSQKQVELFGKPKTRKQQSQQLLPGVSHLRVEGAEDEQTSSKALRQLKRINDHKEMLKGRLSVLQIQEEKNDFRAFLNDHRYQFHQQMRDQMERQRLEKSLHHRRNYLQLLQSQDKAKREREVHRSNLSKVQGELSEMKVNDYKSTKQRSEEFGRSLSMAVREEIELKRQRKQQIREYEKSQREKVQEYMRNKMQQLKASDSESVQKLSRVREERAKQIEQLSKLQAAMLEKQARSRMGNEESEKKLRQFLSQQARTEKTEMGMSTSHTTKLPPLSARRQTQDILIV